MMLNIVPEHQVVGRDTRVGCVLRCMFGIKLRKSKFCLAILRVIK